MEVLAVFKTIVVPTDGSEAASRAVDVACDLASKFGSRIVLVNVLMSGATAADLRDTPGLHASDREEIERFDLAATSPASVMVDGGYVALPVPTELVSRIGTHLLEAMKHRVVARGIPGPVLKLKEGDPAEAIVEVVTSEEADTIVMGRRGMGRFEALISGSVSARVAGLSNCTLVLVH